MQLPALLLSAKSNLRNARRASRTATRKGAYRWLAPAASSTVWSASTNGSASVWQFARASSIETLGAVPDTAAVVLACVFVAAVAFASDLSLSSDPHAASSDTVRRAARTVARDT